MIYQHSSCAVRTFLHSDGSCSGFSWWEVAVCVHCEFSWFEVDGDGCAGGVFAGVGECFLEDAVGGLLLWGG